MWGFFCFALMNKERTMWSENYIQGLKERNCDDQSNRQIWHVAFLHAWDKRSIYLILPAWVGLRNNAQMKALYTT